MSKHGKLLISQIIELANHYHVVMPSCWSGNRVFVRFNDISTYIGQWDFLQYWSRDEWQRTFERVSGTKTADLWRQ